MKLFDTYHHYDIAFKEPDDLLCQDVFAVLDITKLRYFKK